MIMMVYGCSSLSKERRKRIAIIDTGISYSQLNKPYMCRDKAVVAVNHSGIDKSRSLHGTNITGLIGERIDTKHYCITHFALKDEHTMSAYLSALLAVVDYDIVGLNIALSGETESVSEPIVLKMLDIRGVKIFVAAGNQNQELKRGCKRYPACHRNTNPDINVVGNMKDGFKHRSSNYGEIVNVWEDGIKKGDPELTGTSQATAIATGKYFSKSNAPVKRAK